ncbi:MAG: glycoside hydrolase [Gemmatimonadetes bacterium]|nr:glycoside hydrolase [Gemmatimonadota bacterium]
MRIPIPTGLIALILLGAARTGTAEAAQREPPLLRDYVAASVSAVPESPGFHLFYRKYTDALGIPVLSSDKVPDVALVVARDIVNSMLAARPDLRGAMMARNWRVGIMAETEITGDIPEHANRKRPDAPPGEPVTQEDRDYWARRARGLGGNPTTGAEENLLGYPGTRYFGENIFMHEFSHAIMGGGIRNADSVLYRQIREAYDSAMAKGLYIHEDGDRHYATTNANEYWAEGAQWWFHSNYGECFRGGERVESPDDLKRYDPRLYTLLGQVFNTHRISMDVFHARNIRPGNRGILGC